MTDQDYVREVKALERMDLAGLKAKYVELFGEEPLSRYRTVLREQIRRRMFGLRIQKKKRERAAKQSAEGGESMDASATTQISRLQKMGLKELRAEYERVFGKPTRSRNRKQLFAQIARKLQAEPVDEKSSTAAAKPILTATFEPKRKRQAKGAKAGKKPGTSKKPEPKQRPPKPIGARDPRLPKPGTTITKTYKGKTINVRVLEHGFECGGKEFRSLSAVAKHVTGAIWNGFLFFGLVQRETKKS